MPRVRYLHVHGDEWKEVRSGQPTHSHSWSPPNPISRDSATFRRLLGRLVLLRA